MIDSVIFDCDGTLLDSMPAWHALQERFAQRAGIALNPMQLVRLNANTLPETAAFFHRECGLGGSDEEVLNDAHQILLDEYRNVVPARSGAVELVRRLSGEGVKLAVASSSPIDFLQAGLERERAYSTYSMWLPLRKTRVERRQTPSSARVSLSGWGVKPANSWCVDDSAYALRAMAQAGFMTLGIYDSDNAGTKEDLREAADSFINGFEELDYECFARGWKRESVAIR